jgi:hypothetical protein
MDEKKMRLLKVQPTQRQFRTELVYCYITTGDRVEWSHAAD